eukprot:TRINITY_DN4420_c0_g1_i1.p1 TRINITY_DN4420_c0_g1~~TRINITY_DN4420_c0_g1_i1.p1  ORF type:complete len:110 (+),score=19.88 TRINITY_DN4420_c0_g1_i1:779-1108(+)
MIRQYQVVMGKKTKTNISHVESLSADLTNSNFGGEKGLSVLLNNEREKVDINCKPLIESGCLDHITHTSSQHMQSHRSKLFPGNQFENKTFLYCRALYKAVTGKSSTFF